MGRAIPDPGHAACGLFGLWKNMLVTGS